MDNLQRAMGEAEWERRRTAEERGLYQVMPPGALTVAQFDEGHRQRRTRETYTELLTCYGDECAELELAGIRSGFDRIEWLALVSFAGWLDRYCTADRAAVAKFAEWLDGELVYVQPYDGETTNASNLMKRYFAEMAVL